MGLEDPPKMGSDNSLKMARKMGPELEKPLDDAYPDLEDSQFDPPLEPASGSNPLSEAELSKSPISLRKSARIPEEFFDLVPQEVYSMSESQAHDVAFGKDGDETVALEALEEPGLLEAEAKNEPSGNAGASNQVCEAKHESQPAMKQDQTKKKTPEQVILHRANSLAWHQKWISTGVPRISNAQPEAQPEVQPEILVREVARPVNAGAHLGEERDKFIKHWIENCGLPKSMERRNAALKAWMSSSVRANLIAGRAGVQK